MSTEDPQLRGEILDLRRMEGELVRLLDIAKEKIIKMTFVQSICTIE